MEEDEYSTEYGTAVIVGGQVVAWFAEFNEEATDWCRDNYFGQWLTWRAKFPETIPLTEEEELEVQKRVAEFTAFFKPSEELDE